MFKWILIVVLGLAIWGGLYNAFDFSDKEGNFTIQIDKDKALESLREGADKAQNVLENIDKLSADPAEEKQ